MMPIKRARRKRQFTLIPNVGLQDNAMSFKARGLLAYMLTLPDDWMFYERELIEHTTDGRDAVRSALKELSAHGYLVRTQIRNNNGGFNSSDWTVYDTPQKPLTENPSTVGMPSNQDSVNEGSTDNQPLTENPSPENPTTDNPPLQSTNYTKNLLNKETTTTTSTPDSLKSLQEFWENNGFGSMTQFLWQSFEYWMKDFEEMGAARTDASALIIRAMQACVIAGADKRNYGYLNGVLKRYASNRFKSVAEVEAAEKARQAKQSSKQVNSKPRSSVYIDHSRDAQADDWERKQAEQQKQMLADINAGKYGDVDSEV